MYATMLVEYNHDSLEGIPTTTIDSGQGEDSDRDEAAQTESGSKKTGSSSMTRPTEAIPQSLLDEFIFNTKESVTQQSAGRAYDIPVVGMLVTLGLCVFMVL